MSLARKPLRSSHTATTTAAATITMKAVFQKARDAAMAARSTTAEATAAGRSRPARPWSFVGDPDAGGVEVVIGGGSDFEQLGFLVLEEVVDRVGVLLGQAVEPLLGPADVVLAHLAVLLELLEGLLG